MAGYRREVILLMNQMATRIPLRVLTSLTGQHLVLPVYHLVSDEKVPHIEHLYPVKTPSAFREDLEFLLRHFQPIDFFTLLNYVKGRKLDHPSFFLTFDDGLQEFYSVVAPILQTKGVPAMNFLNSEFIDNRGLFYRYKISLIIDHLIDPRKHQALKEVQKILKMENHPPSLTFDKLRQFKYADTPIIDKLANRLNLDFNQYLIDQKPYLSTTQIQQLINKDFTFGAHSIDHPIYNEIEASEQIRQTTLSLNQITNTFSLPYRAFAFPFTDHQVSKSFFDHFSKDKQRLDLSFGSAGLKMDIYPWHQQRIPMEMGNLTAKQIIHSEYLYYLLKGFIGKNRIKRT